MDTPVVLIIFNRPDKTDRVFAEIRKARPRRLLVVADGPRRDRPGEAERCAAARAIVERVDWECEVLTNYSGVNLGCGRRPATGIAWAFEQVPEAIILEDDCVPHPTFFRFCAELLERYRDDERVMHIGGHNLQFGRAVGPYSYFFSRFPIAMGGWATWRRAWRHFDLRVAAWPTLRDTPWLLDIVEDSRLASGLSRIFDEAHRKDGDVDYWDHQWTFACWSQTGLAILPAVNLASNIGFDGDGTHTRRPDRRGNLPVAPMAFPLLHPPCVVRDAAADRTILHEAILPFVHPLPTRYFAMRQRCLGVLPGPLRRSLSLMKARLAARQA